MIAHLRLEVRERPALGNLIGAMGKLSQRQRNEIARLGRKAKAAKVPWIRRLTWAAVAEAKRLAGGEDRTR
jgi:hypothetical protein